MSDQAIIALVGFVGTALGTLIYYLISGLKFTLKESTGDLAKKIDTFVAELSKVKETVAVKSTILDYMHTEIESLKKQLWTEKKGNK